MLVKLNHHVRYPVLIGLGIILAALIEFAAQPDQLHFNIILYETSLIIWVGGGLILFGVTLILYRYIRPLSHMGALMTGICSYAIAALVLP